MTDAFTLVTKGGTRYEFGPVEEEGFRTMIRTPHCYPLGRGTTDRVTILGVAVTDTPLGVPAYVPVEAQKNTVELGESFAFVNLAGRTFFTTEVDRIDPVSL